MENKISNLQQELMILKKNKLRLENKYNKLYQKYVNEKIKSYVEVEIWKN